MVLRHGFATEVLILEMPPAKCTTGVAMRSCFGCLSVAVEISWASFSRLDRFPLLCAGPSGVSMAAAVGPFTLSEDLEYAPLAALLAVCRQRRPDVLVLLGPFVDAEHPLLAQGTGDLTFEDIFESQVGIQAIPTACMLCLLVSPMPGRSCCLWSRHCVS